MVPFKVSVVPPVVSLFIVVGTVLPDTTSMAPTAAVEVVYVAITALVPAMVDELVPATEYWAQPVALGNALNAQLPAVLHMLSPALPVHI